MSQDPKAKGSKVPWEQSAWSVGPELDLELAGLSLFWPYSCLLTVPQAGPGKFIEIMENITLVSQPPSSRPFMCS